MKVLKNIQSYFTTAQIIACGVVVGIFLFGIISGPVY
jgi:hypothetical protein